MYLKKINKDLGVHFPVKILGYGEFFPLFSPSSSQQEKLWIHKNNILSPG